MLALASSGCTAGESSRAVKRDPAEPRLSSGDQAQNFPTKTPIKHVVVIFGENISFDHYFGTYPLAANDVNFFTEQPLDTEDRSHRKRITTKVHEIALNKVF